MKKYDVIVVGGGIAGLTAFAYLKEYGERALLLEKERETGGLVDCFEAYGVRFDAGIRAFENSGIIRPMLKELGISLEFIRNPVTVSIGEETVRFDDREQGLEDYGKLLLKFFPGEERAILRIMGEIRRVMGYMDVLYGIDNPLFMDLKDMEYVRRTLLPWLLRYQVNIRKAARLKEPVNDYLARFTKNRSLIDMITQHFFQATPSFFALSYFGLYTDYLYPLGGTGMLSAKLLEKGTGEVRTGSRVVRVDAASRLVSTAAGEVFGYEKLIWAADLKSLYKAVDPQTVPSGRRRKVFFKQKGRILAASGSDSVLSVYYSFDLETSAFEGVGPHMFYTPREEGLNKVLERSWSQYDSFEGLLGWLQDYFKYTTYEISIPALRDGSLAKPGKSGVIVSTLIDYPLVKKVEELGFYEEFKRYFEKYILGLLEEKVGRPLEEALAGSVVSTPLTIERRTGSSGGAITGWSFEEEIPVVHGFTKIARSIRTVLPDIYQAGQWAFSPSGAPVCILTGKLAAKEADRMIRMHKRNGN